MHDVEYKVQAAVRVERVDMLPEEPEDGVSSDNNSDAAPTTRLVATDVIAAWCECQSGRGGGCHHVCQILQLTRLLSLTDAQLKMWNPDSPTSRACKWIRQNCGVRRGTESDFFHLAPLIDIAVYLRQLRDPKKVALAGGEDEAAKTAGVVAMDRRRDFSSHPDHGVWAEAHGHFQEGKSLSRRQWDLLSKFVDGERVRDKRGTTMAVDVLPPRVRPGSPPDGMGVTAGGSS